MPRPGDASGRGACGPGPASPDSIAGRIAPPDGLSSLIRAWIAHVGGLGRRSADCYRQDVERAVREAGWCTPADLTYLAITGYLDSRRPQWRGTTYNRNLASWRSFTAYLTRAGVLGAEPRAAAAGAVDDGGPGARAASTEEARALVRRAWVRQETDHRCSGNRALYWACMFLGACRLDEPARWRRRHLVLDAPVPYVHWTRDINKSRRECDIALAPELALLLRSHISRMDHEAAAAGLHAGDAEAPVFPRVPSPSTFRADRMGAGIEQCDRRGRAFSGHSGRKWFSTTLTGLGVPEKMVDRLMRHAGRVEHRYYDPTLEEQRDALACLPRLWPEARLDADSGQFVDNLARVARAAPRSGNDLTGAGRIDDDVGDARCARTAPSRLLDPAAAPKHLASTFAGAAAGSKSRGALDRASMGRDPRSTRGFMAPEMPRGGLEPPT
ncbi:MAG: hypothetical protein ACK4WH_01070 [Phycisphaerales bacterium]